MCSDCLFISFTLFNIKFYFWSVDFLSSLCFSNTPSEHFNNVMFSFFSISFFILQAVTACYQPALTPPYTMYIFMCFHNNSFSFFFIIYTVFQDLIHARVSPMFSRVRLILFHNWQQAVFYLSALLKLH